MAKAKIKYSPNPRVFVGSSGANLQLARALHHYLQDICSLTVWDQHVVRPSRFAFSEITREAEHSDFAIFVVGYDERRGRGLSPPYLLNQNVVLEIGLFAALIGLERVYLLAPDDFKTQIQLPSDLQGLTLITYDARRFEVDRNELATLGSAGNKLRTAIGGAASGESRETRHATRLFSEWTSTFQEALNISSTLSVSFIHSRRWRENHGDVIKTRAKAGRLVCSFFVPDLREAALIRSLTQRFDDGPTIPAMISDLFSWIMRLQNDAPSTRVHLLSRAPSYSYYRFENQAFIALYPNSTHRQASPTVQIGATSPSWRFLCEDENILAKENPPIEISDLQGYLKDFNNIWLG